MPPLERTDRRQKAVYWATTGVDDYAQPTLAAPIEIDVRWNDQRHEATDSQGNTITLDGSVVLLIDVDIGALMWLGTLSDWYATGSAGQDTGLMRVVMFNATLDIKGRNVRREAGLKRYKDKEP